MARMSGGRCADIDGCGEQTCWLTATFAVEGTIFRPTTISAAAAVAVVGFEVLTLLFARKVARLSAAVVATAEPATDVEGTGAATDTADTLFVADTAG